MTLNNTHKLILLFACLLISACSSTPSPTQYYLLSQDLGADTRINTTTPPVYIESITLTDYLNQPALVMMMNDQQAQVANYHFWAERLDKAIGKVLTHDLEHSCQCRVFENQLADKQPKNATVLSLHIEQLASNTEGQAYLSGRYRLIKDKQQSVHRFRFNEEIKGRGFQEAVKSKRKLINHLAKDINKTLNL